MQRPAVDVVVPFAGGAAELESLLARLARVELGAGDRIIVADNRPPGKVQVRAPAGPVTIVAAPDVRSSYHARNRGAAAGEAEWLLFVDADVEWSGELLDAYFEPPPAAETAVLAGAIADAPLVQSGHTTLAERYAVAKRIMAAERTLESGERPPYAQTANALVRRAAFESISGFVDEVRSGGDADLGFRLLAAGWQLEPRPGAAAVHRNRRTLRGVMGQKLKHGSGAAWLERRHPGTFPRRAGPGLAVWSARQVLAALPGRGGRRGVDAPALVDVVGIWAFELGRLLPNRARRGGA